MGLGSHQIIQSPALVTGLRSHKVRRCILTPSMASSSNCPNCWTPSSIGQSLLLSYITRGHTRCSTRIYQSCLVIGGRGLVFCTDCVSADMFCASVLGVGGGAVPDQCLPWSMGLSYLALQTHEVSLLLQKATTVTQAAIIVDITEGPGDAEEEMECFHFQRDAEWSLSPFSRMKIAPIV